MVHNQNYTTIYGNTEELLAHDNIINGENEDM